MAFDPENPKHITRLRDAIKWSNDKKEPFMEQRIEHMRQLAGHQFGDQAADDRVAIPIIALAYRIYKRFISMRSPQAIIETQFRELLPAKAKFEMALNFTLKKMKLGDALTDAASEALFRRGCIQIGINPNGELFGESILLENQILDMRARSKTEVGFAGHTFLMGIDEARENPKFSAKGRKALKLYDPEENAERDGVRYDSRSESISLGQGMNEEGIEDRVELTQLWIPSTRTILIMGPQEICKEPLQIIEDWVGPEDGPYIDLSFGLVPGNMMPQGLISMLYEMHITANILFNKAVRQAERQKTNLLAKDSSKDEGDKIADAEDGKMIFTSDPAAFKEYSTGGANQQTLAMVMWAKQMAMLVGGNLESLGGLGAQSGTYGQDRLLAESANETIADVEQDVIEFAGKVIHSVAWHLWNDPLVDIKLMRPIGKTGLSIPTRFTPESRKGEFFDYDFSIEPYSLKPKSPGERKALATAFLTQIVMPLLPAMQQAGHAVDWEFVLKLFARYTNMPELDHMILYTGEQNHDEGMPEGGGMPANTTRRYVRENRSTATRQGQEQAMISKMMAGGNNSPEMAALGKGSE